MNTCSCKCFHFQYQKNWDSNMRNNQARVHQKVNDQRLQPCITQDCEHTAVKKVTFTLPVMYSDFHLSQLVLRDVCFFCSRLISEFCFVPCVLIILHRKYYSYIINSWIVFSSLLWRIKWNGFLLDFVHLDLIGWYCCEWQDAPPSHQ